VRVSTRSKRIVAIAFLIEILRLTELAILHYIFASFEMSSTVNIDRHGLNRQDALGIEIQAVARLGALQRQV
jgi:hypothetical protein